MKVLRVFRETRGFKELPDPPGLKEFKDHRATRALKERPDPLAHKEFRDCKDSMEPRE